jgi:RNA polymerase sigma-70 factor (ECF subfamily)
VNGTNLTIILSKYMKERGQKGTDEDTEIVSLCKRGNIDAFEVLVNKYQKKMLNIAYRMLNDYDEACEIVQDAFVSAYKSMKYFREESRFSTWLYTIVVNLSKNRLKQLRVKGHREELTLDNPVDSDNKHIKRDPVSDEPSVLEKIEKRETRDVVQRCINSLEDEFREVIVLRDIQGFSYDEVGDMLKIKEGTVKSRLFRGREALKNCLKRIFRDL